MSAAIAPINIEERLEALREALKKSKLDGILISSQENRRFFSGFTATDPMLNESSGVLLILLNEAYLITDGRYLVSAAEEAKAFEVVTTGLGGLPRTLEALIKEPTRLAFEPDYLSYGLFKNLSEIKNI
ncbi:MAG: aminopeptidase P family N-terminal domain-containing protein, partial [Deltaproteobacteria bacterium]|nr:aminopeptidase P family N-terminal domain-containing protein [Deltaproteobacteria bacterium]